MTEFRRRAAHSSRALSLAHDAPRVLMGLAAHRDVDGRYVAAITPRQQALRLVPRCGQAMEQLEITCHLIGEGWRPIDGTRR